jgi:hypothetical protein
MGVVPDQLGAEVAVQSGTGPAVTGSRTVEQRTVLAEPGRYRLDLRLPDGGHATFALRVRRGIAGAPAARPERARWSARLGETVRVRFRVSGAAPGDAHVLAYGIGSATTQLRVAARRVAGGFYEARLAPRVPGDYGVQLLSEQAVLGTPDGAAILHVRP